MPKKGEFALDGCKKEVINYYNNGKRSQKEVAKKFNVEHHTVYNTFKRWRIKTGLHKRTGDKNPAWNGGMKFHNGKKMIYTPGHPHPNLHGIYVYESRLVMEKHIGRYLKSEEIVHHKDQNPLNNEPENLQIVTRAEHNKIHGRQRKEVQI